MNVILCACASSQLNNKSFSFCRLLPVLHIPLLHSCNPLILYQTNLYCFHLRDETFLTILLSNQLISQHVCTLPMKVYQFTVLKLKESPKSIHSIILTHLVISRLSHFKRLKLVLAVCLTPNNHKQTTPINYYTVFKFVQNIAWLLFLVSWMLYQICFTPSFLV